MNHLLDRRGGRVALQLLVPVTLLALWQLDLNSGAARSLVNIVLSFALILTATSLIFALCLQPIYGALSDRIGRKPLLIWFGVMGTLFTIVYGMAV